MVHLVARMEAIKEKNGDVDIPEMESQGKDCPMTKCILNENTETGMYNTILLDNPTEIENMITFVEKL